MCKLAAMNWRLLGVLGAGTAAWLGSLGCSSDAPSDAAPDGVAGVAGVKSVAGVAGADGLDSGGASGASSAGNAGAAASPCLEEPVPQRTDGTIVSLPLQLMMGGKPFVFGQSNRLDDGGSLVPLNFRFYISEVQLLTGAGQPPVAVDLVSAGGAPEPYGVHLFNADDADSGTLRLLAPPGQYSGLTFALGIKLSCNQRTPASSSEPLTDASQMTWPHAGGFLFLRFEARYSAADQGGAAGASATAGIPPVVHMGGNMTQELVPRVTVSGALAVPASGRLEKGLSLVMDEIFKGATADIDVSDVTVGFLNTPESEAGERLRRELPQLHAFVLGP